MKRQIGKVNVMQYSYNGRVVATCLAPNRRKLSLRCAVATARAHVGDWDDVCLISTTGKILDVVDNPDKGVAAAAEQKAHE